MAYSTLLLLIRTCKNKWNKLLKIDINFNRCTWTCIDMYHQSHLQQATVYTYFLRYIYLSLSILFFVFFVFFHQFFFDVSIFNFFNVLFTKCFIWLIYNLHLFINYCFCVCLNIFLQVNFYSGNGIGG